MRLEQVAITNNFITKMHHLSLIGEDEVIDAYRAISDKYAHHSFISNVIASIYSTLFGSCFHRWEMWEVIVTGPITNDNSERIGSYTTQKRTCARCNLSEYRTDQY